MRITSRSTRRKARNTVGVGTVVLALTGAADRRPRHRVGRPRPNTPHTDQPATGTSEPPL
jgi:hypothetical protein